MLNKNIIIFYTMSNITIELKKNDLPVMPPSEFELLERASKLIEPSGIEGLKKVKKKKGTKSKKKTKKRKKSIKSKLNKVKTK